MTRVAGIIIFLLVLGAIGFTCLKPIAAKPQSNQTLRINIFNEPISLDPRQAIDVLSKTVLKMLFEGLTRLDSEGNPKPAVAREIEISPDGLQYTFHLRESYWNNGDPLTAHDFEYAWKNSLDPSFPAPYADKLYVIKNAEAANRGELPLSEVAVKAIDNQTLIVNLEQATPYFLELLANNFFLPIHKANDKSHPSWANDASQHYLSNGPFRLQSWQHNNAIVLEKNPNYWDEESVKLAGIHMYMVAEASTELIMFENGELDWAGNPSIGLPDDSIKILKSQGKLNIHSTPCIYMYMFNTKKTPLNNVNIRKALCYSVNRHDLAHHVYQTAHSPALGLTRSLNQEKASYFVDNDLEQAKVLFQQGLQELGLTLETCPPITISYNSSELHHKMAQVLQEKWKDIFGLRVNLETQEFKTHVSNLQSMNFDVGRISWAAEYSDPSCFLKRFCKTTNGLNSSAWSSEDYNALVDAADSSTDPMERQKLFQQAESLLMDHMPIIPILYLNVVYIKNPSLQDVVITPLGDVDFKTAVFR